MRDEIAATEGCPGVGGASSLRADDRVGPLSEMVVVRFVDGG